VLVDAIYFDEIVGKEKKLNGILKNTGAEMMIFIPRLH